MIFGVMVGAVLGYWSKKTNEIGPPSQEASTYANAPVDKKSNLVKIISVIDGDTIVTEDNKIRIRLRQLDAPEMGFCGADEAKKLLVELVAGKNVRLVEQSFENSGAHRPMYLVYTDDILVNEKLLSSGWVKYHSDKTSATENLKAAAKIAVDNKLGIFSDKCTQVENRINPKCNIKGNIDPDNSKVRIYQMPGCVQYKTTVVDLWRGEKWFCSEDEAKAEGFVKSRRCP